MNRVYYDADELNDDFAGTHITAKKLPPDYKYVPQGRGRKAARFFVYKLFATPIIMLAGTVSVRYKNKRALRGYKKGGAFIFDVSSEYKLREIVGNNTFCEDRDELAYMWFNRLCEDRMEMDVTLFAREADGRFRRGDEHHVQYIHEDAALLAAAEGAGFAIRSVGGSYAAGAEPADARVNVCCVRR